MITPRILIEKKDRYMGRVWRDSCMHGRTRYTCSPWGALTFPSVEHAKKNLLRDESVVQWTPSASDSIDPTYKNTITVLLD